MTLVINVAAFLTISCIPNQFLAHIPCTTAIVAAIPAIANTITRACAAINAAAAAIAATNGTNVILATAPRKATLANLAALANRPRAMMEP